MRHRPIVVRTAQLGVCALILVGASLARQPHVLSANSADPTFAEDVAPIFYRNCTACHHPGGLAPFSLLDYDSAKANIDEMRGRGLDGRHAAVARRRSARHVPQRSPPVRCREADDPALDRRRREAGRPEGAAAASPVYPSTWAMGTPDRSCTMPEDFTVPASGTVEYQYFEIPTNFTEDKWVQAIEFKPGAREVVHHVLVYAKVPPSPRCRARRAPAAATRRGSARAAAALRPQPAHEATDGAAARSTRCIRRRASSAR